MSEDQQEWIRKAQRGDRDAFRRVLEAHYAMIYRVSYRFTGNMSDAQDVTQEVCMALTHKLSSYRGASSFTTWLYRVIVNSCRDFLKKRTSDTRRDGDYSELAAMQNADAAEDRRKIVWLYRAIAALETPYKETALLVLAEDMSHAEAATVLDCKESTISWRMHEIRKQLIHQRDGYHE